MVRAKFTVSQIIQSNWGDKDGRTVKLQPQYDTSIPEDQRFCQATPSGSMEMYITNPEALKQFQLGETFYVDFTPVPKAQ